MLDDKELLYSIATLYYKELLTQQAIAGKLHISRPMVSRALTKAISEGIVHIEVIPPAGVSEREVALAKQLNIRKVVIAPQLNASNCQEDIAMVAAKVIPEAIKKGMHVGIGWGNTVYRSMLSLPAMAAQEDITFVPLVGSLGRSEPQYQVNVIIDRIAEKYKGKALFFNIPAFVREQQMLDYLLNDQEVKMIQSVWKTIDVAIVGLGSFQTEPSFPVAEYSSEVLEELHQKGVVGDILGRFFNDHGFLVPDDSANSFIPANEHAKDSPVYLGIPISNFLKAKEIICLCGGKAKVPGIRAACALGYMTTLVTDTQTAKELLEVTKA